MTEHVREKLVAANDIDAALEESLTTVWDAKVYSWDNSKYPFNEWMLKPRSRNGIQARRSQLPARERPLDVDVQGHQAVLRRYQPALEFRRMLNRFVREVIVPQGKLRLPVAVKRFTYVGIMLPDHLSRVTYGILMEWRAARGSHGAQLRLFYDTTCYSEPACAIPVIENPAATNTVVAYPTNAALAPYTDPYYRGFDNNLPDYYREKEWNGISTRTTPAGAFRHSAWCV